MFEDPPKKDEADSNVINLSERRNKKKSSAAQKIKKMGRPGAREGVKQPNLGNQEKMIADEVRTATDFISSFEKNFVAELDNKTRELRGNLYENREYIFRINVINFSQSITHWQRELMDMQIRLEKTNAEKPLLTIKTYLQNLSFFHFDGIGTRAGVDDDAWFVLGKFEELARKFKK